jgi:hypothetical protein
MIMPPRLRKFVFTAHVTTTVGWLGAVVVFLALAVVGLTSQDAQTVRGAYLVMAPAAWFVLVPLAFASLLTGIVQSLGTEWGVFRHYWVRIPTQIDTHSGCKSAPVPIEIGTCSDANRHTLFRVS